MRCANHQEILHQLELYTPDLKLKKKKKEQPKQKRKCEKQNRPQLGLFIYDAAGWERHWRKIELEGME